MFSPSKRTVVPQQIVGPEPSRAPRTMELTIANLEAHNILYPGASQSTTWVPTEIDSNADTERQSVNEDQGGDNNQPATSNDDTTQGAFQQSSPSNSNNFAVVPPLYTRSDPEQNPPSLLQRIGSAFQSANPLTSQRDSPASGFAPQFRSAETSNVGQGSFNNVFERNSRASTSQAEQVPRDQPLNPFVPPWTSGPWRNPGESSADSNPAQFGPSSSNTTQQPSRAFSFSNSTSGVSQEVPTRNAFGCSVTNNPFQFSSTSFNATQQQTGPFSLSNSTSGLSQEVPATQNAFGRSANSNPFQFTSSNTTQQQSGAFSFSNSTSGVSQEVPTTQNTFERAANSNPFQFATSSSTTQQRSGPFSFSNSTFGVSQEVPTQNAFGSSTTSNPFQFTSSNTMQQQPVPFSFPNSTSGVSQEVPAHNAFGVDHTFNPFQFTSQSSTAPQEQPNLVSFDSESDVPEGISAPSQSQDSAFGSYAHSNNPFLAASQSLAGLSAQQPGGSQPTISPFSSGVNPFQQAAQDQPVAAATPSGFERYANVNPFQQAAQSQPTAATSSSFDNYANVNPFRLASQTQTDNAFTASGSGGDGGSSQGYRNIFEQYAALNPFRSASQLSSGVNSSDASSSALPFFAENSKQGVQSDFLTSQTPNEAWYQQQQQQSTFNPFSQSAPQPLPFPLFDQQDALGGGPSVAQSVGNGPGSFNPFVLGDSGNMQQFGYDHAAAMGAAAFGRSEPLYANSAFGSGFVPEAFVEPHSEAEPFVIDSMGCQGFWHETQRHMNGSASQFDLNSIFSASCSFSTSPSAWAYSLTSASNPNPLARSFKSLPKRGVQLCRSRRISSSTSAGRSSRSSASETEEFESESGSESSRSSALGKRKATEWQGGMVDLEFGSVSAKRQTLRRKEIENAYERMGLRFVPVTSESSPVESPTWPSPFSIPISVRTQRSPRSYKSLSGKRAFGRFQTRTSKGPAVLSNVVQGLASVFSRFSFS